MHTPPQSNNPFRASMLVVDESQEQQQQQQEQQQVLPPSLTSPAPLLYKTPSTTTTITPEPRVSNESEDLANAKTATASTTSIPMDPTRKDKEVIITIHDTDSCTLMPAEPPSCAIKPSRQSCALNRHSTDGRRSMRCSMQVDETGMWPARRMMQKEAANKKRLWMWGKVLIAVLIIGVAVAVGLGISKAVNKK
ncbi:hypothetical protein FN846DRAFT_645025 [Sphaerosporella brunnea]|uniref:Uncharacterized protein n=1 Tax=Sphaerosporella brunnea TaxID=1250544 RepID=A0A5J5EBL4_9PEZI|nr:hypothetical protein FN846DRAFT_645025 [Sphaerosporella brunnea]